MAISSINTNLGAYSAQQNLRAANERVESSITRLSSGNRIIRASDDVAGLSLGSTLRANVATLKTALNNTTQASTLLQIADGGLASIGEALQRQKALATQANSGTLTNTERAYLNQEFQALSAQIDQVAATSSFGSVKLLDGTLSGSSPLQSAYSITTAATITGTTANTVISSVAFADAGGTAEDTTFYGDLSQGTFNALSLGSGAFLVSYTLNGTTYQGTIADYTDLANTGEIVLSNGNGTLTITAANDDLSAVGVTDNAAGAVILKDALNDFFGSATAFQTRSVAKADVVTNGQTATGSAIKDSNTAGTILAGFNGDDVVIKSQFFNGRNLPTISDFSYTGTPANGGGVSFSVTIDGRVYSTATATDGTDIGAFDAFGAGSGIMRFYLNGDSATNPNEYIQLDLDEAVSVIDINSNEAATGLTNALNNLFGRSGGGLSLQVGLSSGDTLSVAIGNSSTDTLFVNSEGVSKDLDISTAAGAVEASDVLDLAIARINSKRADLGALQSRVGFTAANLETAVQNQDAARAVFLDTDVSAESTKYAQEQVKLQASISVLAQANQIPQNLLKLIG